MDIASEFRYRNPLIDEHDLVIGISQSGETADTLAAMRLARERGAKVLAITNIMGSQATRDADGVIFTRAGLEIGVAATKTFVAQVAAMSPVRAQAGRAARHARPRGAPAGSCTELRQMPHLISEMLEAVDEPVQRIAEHWKDRGFFLYLGRHVGLADLPRGRAQAEGDLLHPDRRLRGRRDEARADRAARRARRRWSAWRPTRRCSTR